jgi:nicotinate-nucleotide adenylyltransferase
MSLESKKKVALLGGSFDPPHLAHQMACLYLLQAEDFDQVWLIPCFRHAFGKDMAKFEQRVDMSRLMADIFHGQAIVSDVERELAQNYENRTIDTVKYLQSKYSDDEFVLIIGSDILGEVSKWKDFEELDNIVDILVLLRPGFEVSGSKWKTSKVMLPDISSTQVRDRLAKGESVQGLLPRTVVNYLSENSIYK